MSWAGFIEHVVPFCSQLKWNTEDLLSILSLDCYFYSILLDITSNHSIPWANIKIRACNAFITKSLNLAMAWTAHNTHAFLGWTCAKTRRYIWAWCWWCWNWIWDFIAYIDLNANMWFLKETMVKTYQIPFVFIIR